MMTSRDFFRDHLNLEYNGMAMCLNLESLGREILQMKIKYLNEIFSTIYMSEWFTSKGSPLSRIVTFGTRVRFPRGRTLSF